MFNGIIKRTGKIKSIKKDSKNCLIEVITKMSFSTKDIGMSISCSGVCLTLESYKKGLIKFYVSKETLKKTTFSYLKKGDVINIEKPLEYGDKISGHYVQGHVDTVAQVKKIVFIGKSWLINFKLKKNYKNYMMEKASININGVSLTIAKIIMNGFQIAIIPQTLKLTNLIDLKEKDIVNVEFDILSKYVKKFIKKKKI
jgi:riboflavin synthase